MVDLLNKLIYPPPNIRYSIITPPTFKKELGVIEILPSQSRPHLTKRECGKISENIIFIRRASKTYIAGRDEILKMIDEDHWRLRKEEMQEQIQEIEDDIKEHYFIARQACQSLYYKLPKKNRKKFLKEILANKPEYFSKWFGEE